MRRAALYARYSTDLQSAASIEDQHRICEARARAEGLTIVARYGDDAVSGSTPIERRAGGRELLADAAAGKWDVLIVEALDRISRDQVDLLQTTRRLEFQRIRIIGASDHYDSQSGVAKVQALLGGFTAEKYIDDLRVKTHRGLDGQLARGYSAGGKSFGYRTEPDVAPDGRVLGRRLVIVPEEAEIVRWIFDQVGAGAPARRVVHELNARGVKSPRGSSWAISGLYGSPERGIGVLNNELYIGKVVWNRTEWVKDPTTGKRTWRMRPAADWRVQDRPELRIVSDEAWQRVRARMGRSPDEVGAVRRGRPARTLFAGLLRCGVCGGPMAAINGRQYGCVARKDRGPTVCAGTLVLRQAADDRLLGVVRAEVLAPEALIEAQRAIATMLAQRKRERAGGDQARKKRLAELEQEIGRLVDAIATVGVSPALASRLQAAEAERAQLHASAPQADEQLERAAAAALAAYRGMRLQLQEALDRDRERARTLLAEMLGPVTIAAEGDQVWASLGEAQMDKRPAVAGEPSVSKVGCGGALWTLERRRIRLA